MKGLVLILDQQRKIALEHAVSGSNHWEIINIGHTDSFMDAIVI